MKEINMESHSLRRDYQDAFGTPSPTEQCPKRYVFDGEGQFESLLATTDLASFSQKILVISQMKDMQFINQISEKLFSDIAIHLKKVINQSPADQLSYPDWGIHLGNIMCGLQQFQGEELDPLLFCIAELLTDESKPWLSSPAVRNLFFGLAYMPGDHDEGYSAVLSAAERHIKHIDYLSADAVCMVLTSFTHLNQFDNACGAVLNAVIPHISRVERFDPYMIGDAFFSMGGLNEAGFNGPVVDAVVNVLVTRISLTDQLNCSEISNVIYCLAHTRRVEIVDAGLYALILHISYVDQLRVSEKAECIFNSLSRFKPSAAVDGVLNAFARCFSCHEQLDEAMMGEVLDELQQLEPSAGAAAVMNALVPHLCNATVLDIDAIEDAFFCLKNLTSSNEAIVERVLHALTEQVNREFKNEIPSVIFVAKIILSLMVFLQKKSDAATSLVSALLDKLDYSFDREKLPAFDEQEKIIMHLLKDRRTPEEIDLRGLSPSLAEFYLNTMLNELHNKKMPPSQLQQLKLYGKLGHVLYKKTLLSRLKIIYGTEDVEDLMSEKVKLIVQKVISKEVNCQRGEWVANWDEEGYMTLVGNKDYRAY